MRRRQKEEDEEEKVNLSIKKYNDVKKSVNCFSIKVQFNVFISLME